MKLQLGAISRPSLLLSAGRENNRLVDRLSQYSEAEVDNGQGQLLFLPRRCRKCNCNARYAKLSYGEALLTSRYGHSFGHEWLLRSGTHSTGSHHRTCPMYSSTPTVATARFSVRICGALLNRAVEASISITRGAGGFSISQRLHCPRVVHRESKAFNLVRTCYDQEKFISNISDWQGFLDRKIQKLERLFHEGQASPHDVDPEGNTLLHVRARQEFSAALIILADRWLLPLRQRCHEVGSTNRAVS